MDQDAEEEQAIKPVQTPSVLGSTTLPKVVLSYRWTIDTASTLVQEVQQCLTLRSPTFAVLLPLMNAPKEKTTWSLLAQNSNSTTISLCQGGTASSDKYSSKVLVSECTFSFLDPESGSEMYSAVASTKEHALGGGSMQECVRETLGRDNIKACLFNDTLTVQVKANLFCVTDSSRTALHALRVPMDSIRSEMHSLYRDEVFTDVTLKCKSEEFKVHRAVLASQSPVFRKMFEVDMKEKKCGVVMIDDFDPPVLSDLVTYLYTGAAPNVGKLARELLNAANKYELPRLFAMCESELEKKIEVESVVDTLLLADRHSAVNLKRACLDFIYQHSADVYMTSKWKDLKDNLDQHAALIIEVMEYRP